MELLHLVILNLLLLLALRAVIQIFIPILHLIQTLVIFVLLVVVEEVVVILKLSLIELYLHLQVGVLEKQEVVAVVQVLHRLLTLIGPQQILV